MSLILEALRKSEAERRRGRPPDLHAELPPVPARRVPTAAAWWVAAAVAALAAGAWWATRPPQPTASPPQPEAAPSTAPEPQHRPSPALPARTPPAASRASVPQSVETPSAATRTSTRTAPAAPPANEAERPQAPAAPGEGAATAARSASATLDPAAPPVPPAVAPTAAPETHAAPPPVDDGRALSLAELDPGTRNALPPLKLSMHLWNPYPARRFVILDGQRLGEGDRVGEASIVRIERDGVLLEWHGRGIRVPVR